MTCSPGAKACGEVTYGLTTVLSMMGFPPVAHLNVGLSHLAIAVELPGLTKNGPAVILSSHLHEP